MSDESLEEFLTNEEAATEREKWNPWVSFAVPALLHQAMVDAAAERHVELDWLMCRLLQEAMDRLKPATEFCLVGTVRTHYDEPF